MPDDADTHSGRHDGEGHLADWRLKDLERRVGRLEAFVLGNLMAIAMAVAGAVFAGLGLTSGS